MLDHLQQWWLDSSSGPEFLFAVRIVSTVFAVTASLTWAWLSRTRISEASWDRRAVLVFRVLAGLVALGCLCFAAYFFTAGVLESQRTSSPHRLLVANTCNALLFPPLTLLAVFLRYRYAYKRVWKAVQVQA